MRKLKETDCTLKIIPYPARLNRYYGGINGHTLVVCRSRPMAMRAGIRVIRAVYGFGLKGDKKDSPEPLEFILFRMGFPIAYKKRGKAMHLWAVSQPHKGAFPDFLIHSSGMWNTTLPYIAHMIGNPSFTNYVLRRACLNYVINSVQVLLGAGANPNALESDVWEFLSIEDHQTTDDSILDLLLETIQK